MPDPNVKIIVNPNADLGRAWQSSAELRKIVDEYGPADWSGTVYPVHAQELAERAALEGYDLVIAVGGDGTIHEVVNGLMQVPVEKRPRLGIVPFGSGNDFSHAVGIDPRLNYSIRQIFNGEPKAIDIGKLRPKNGSVEYWSNAVGIGFDALALIRFQQMKRLRGFVAYMAAVLQTIAKGIDSPRMQVKTDRESWEDDILMLVSCNGSREGGGFLVAPEARPDDGVFHYAWIEKVSRMMLLRILPEVMKGTHGRFSQVRIGEFEKLRIVSEGPLYIHTDGEIYAGFDSDVREIEIEILPGAIEVMS